MTICIKCKLQKLGKAPYCNPCNAEICLTNKYKREAKADPKAFAEKIQRQDTRLGQMLRALSEVTIRV